MKTTKEWFETLDEKYREKALKNMTSPTAKHFSLLGALSNGFDWNRSYEGTEFWTKVFREIKTGVPFEIDPKKSAETETVTESKTLNGSQKVEEKETILIENTVDSIIEPNTKSNSLANYSSLDELNFSIKKN